jgi:hypothetical protein
VTQRIEPVGPRRELAPAERVVLTPVERELERERREQRRRKRVPKRSPEPPRDGGLDVRA